MYDATLANRQYHFKIFDMSVEDGGPVPYGGGAFGLPPLVKGPFVKPPLLKPQTKRTSISK